MTPPNVTIQTHDPNTALAEIINQLRSDLQTMGFSFGALFVAEHSTGAVALLMADSPQALRMAMVRDLKKTILETEERFKQ